MIVDPDSREPGDASSSDRTSISHRFAQFFDVSADSENAGPVVAEPR